MLDVLEARGFGPILELSAWRSIAADFIACIVEHLTKLQEGVIFVGACILGVRQGMEILEFDPAAWFRLAASIPALA